MLRLLAKVGDQARARAMANGLLSDERSGDACGTNTAAQHVHKYQPDFLMRAQPARSGCVLTSVRNMAHCGGDVLQQTADWPGRETHELCAPPTLSSASEPSSLNTA